MILGKSLIFYNELKIHTKMCISHHWPTSPLLCVSNGLLHAVIVVTVTVYTVNNGNRVDMLCFNILMISLQRKTYREKK